VESPWAKVPLTLANHAGLTLTALRVFVYVDHRCGKRGWWYGQQAIIAEGLGLTERAVRGAVADLRDWGFLETERQGADRGTVLLYKVVPQLQDVDLDEQGATGTSVPIAHLSDRNGSSYRSASDRNEGSGATGTGVPVQEEPTDTPPDTDPETSDTDRPTAPPDPPALGPRLLDVDEAAGIVERVKVTKAGNPDPVLAPLRALWDEFNVGRPPFRIEMLMLEWCELLEPADVDRVQVLARDADRPSWAFAEQVLSRVASDRERGRDPWPVRPPRRRRDARPTGQGMPEQSAVAAAANQARKAELLASGMSPDVAVATLLAEIADRGAAGDAEGAQQALEVAEEILIEGAPGPEPRGLFAEDES
jgi:hypothetical protein